MIYAYRDFRVKPSYVVFRAASLSHTEVYVTNLNLLYGDFHALKNVNMQQKTEGRDHRPGCGGPPRNRMQDLVLALA